jgi:AbrB family looped-hinge helix DNA binding protein
MHQPLASGTTMKEIRSTITKKGQVTIPAEVRRHLGVGAPDKVTFVIDEEDGSVRLRAPRYPDLRALRGAAGSLERPLPWKEMREIAREDRLAGEPVGER